MFGSGTKDAVYFDGFSELAQKTEQAAAIVVRMLEQVGDDVAPPSQLQSSNASDVKKLETAGDIVKGAMIRRLRENWITPLDRVDIHELVIGLDSILDLVEAVADRIVLFEVKSPPPAAIELARVLVEAVKRLTLALVPLRDKSKAPEMLTLCEEIFRFETAGDHHYRGGLADLFKGRMDPLTVMKWREIYDSLEFALDRCQDVGRIIQGVVLEYA